MKEESLHEFYEHVVLPQYGFFRTGVEWSKCESIDLDCEAHYFFFQGDKYALLFCDYNNLGEDHIEEALGLSRDEYEFIL